MRHRAMWTAVAVVLLTALVAGQTQDQYLDVYTAQVKPDKRAEFDAITKKLVAANRQNKGDAWLTMETVYGPGDRVTFISTRQSYADIESATGVFYGALQKAYGKPGTGKLFQDFSQCLVSTRSEIRRRRWDLSSNAPADAAAWTKMLGDARWLRTTVVHVRPGQIAAFESLLKDLKAAREKGTPPQTTVVSQAVAGQEGTVFYVTTLQTALAGFDNLASIQQILGEDAYARYLKTAADVVEHSETVINRFLPELSNPPADVVAVAPAYWQPKPVMAAKAPAAKSAVVNAAETGKMDDKK